ncbi:MAG TPA: AAA family ATPase, partial [Candidatus Eisenbacteria bacterium]
MIAGDLSPYALIRRLGTGGMGEVHLALDERLGRRVALKFLKPEYLGDASARQRFEFEARAAAILHHPDITTLFDFDAARGCISLEFVEGRTLEERLVDGPLTVPEAIRIGIHVCRALDHAHGRNVVHRDIKPSNILLGDDGSIKLTDFGLAKVRDANFRTATGVVLGTAAYMCPEQIKGTGMDARGDLFALGVILHRAVSGRLPWNGEGVAVLYSILHDTPPPLRSIDATIPAPFEAVVKRLLEKEPADRLASAAEVEGYLSEIEESLKRGAATSKPLSPASAGSAPSGAGPAPRREPSGSEMAVIGPASAEAPPRPLIGREGELARLVAALEDTRLGHGRTLLLSSEAGGGKSRLMDEFRSRAEASGRLCLLGRCTPQAARNFQPFVEALEEFARRTAGSRHRSEELTASHPELATVLPTLELLLDPGHDPALEPKSREQLWHLVDTLLKRMARKEPLVLFLDDLHWADEGTLSLLHHVTMHHGGAHLLVVGAYRPEELVRAGEADPPLLDLLRILSASDRFETLALGPLGEADTARLVRTQLGSSAPSGRWLEAIHHRAMGNPFFALEMARLEHGEEAALPGTIADVLNRRLARLSGEEREILEMAAVEGEVFHTDVLEAGTGLPRVTLLKRLRGLGQRHQLIAAVEEGHRFSHGLIREVLLDGIPAELRREYHAAVAGTLLNGYSDRDDWAGRIGHHLFEGGRFADAVSYLTRAGFEARRLFLAERALEFLDQALGALERS